MPVLAPLPLAPRLVVPSAILFDPELVPKRWLPAGTRVEAGVPLFSEPSELHGMPVAPADGVVGASMPVRLVGGREIYGVEFRPEHDAGIVATAPAATTGQTPAPALFDSITPGDLAAWLSRIQRAGIAADRWTCPDLLGQFHDALSRPIDTLICNLLDSDPWLPIARVVVNASASEVAAGLGLLGRLVAAKDWWALVDQSDDIAVPLRRAATQVAKSLRIAPVENDYPQLDPTLLVRSTTGRKLRPGRRPSSQGVMMVDAAAAAAIGRLVLAGQAPQAAMMRVPVVLYDQPGDSIYAMSVPVGTSVDWVLECLGIPAAVREVYVGGPLRQMRARPDEVIGHGELTLFLTPPQPVTPAQPCVRCGWCVEACPTRCRPAGLLEAAQQQDSELAYRSGLDACIECGLCTFVCPSRLPLLEGIRSIRRQIADGVA